MSTIAATSSSTLSNNLFAKLDTQQKGYISATDLQNAAGPSADASTTDALFKQLDTNSDGKVTQSELSVATKNVGDQLIAQLNQSQTGSSSSTTDGTSTTAGTHSAKAEAAHAHRLAGGGAPPGKGGSSDSVTSTDSASSTSSTDSTSAADTNGDGTVSATEAAAFQKLIDTAKAEAQLQQYTNNSGTASAATTSNVSVTV